MTLFSTIFPVVAIIVAAIVNPTNAASTRGMRAESPESLDVPAVANVNDEISSLVADVSFLDMFTQSSAPTHDSIDGCVKAKDSMELSIYIGSSQDGQVSLCPGTIHFYNEIVLTKSIAISCAGPTKSCILDGNGSTRHFVSNTSGVTLSFIDLVLSNGFADDSSTSPITSNTDPQGGSVFLSQSINIFKRCLFYNNRSTSSSLNAGAGAIRVFRGETVVNDCIFLDNSGVTTSANKFAAGGAIGISKSNLKVFDSIFKNNKVKQFKATGGGGGAIFLGGNGNADVLVLNSVFELNEASTVGGAANFDSFTGAGSVNWVYNKDLLFGNNAGGSCDGVKGDNTDCFSVGDNFSFDLPAP